jgi:hypothetical protein
MVESVNDFAFHGLKYKKYLTLHVMMYVEREEVLKFMFTVNKSTRAFLEHNFITIRNGFINEGLIPFNFMIGSESYFYLYS